MKIEKSKLIISLIGAVLFFVATCFAVGFWQKERKLQTNSSTDLPQIKISSLKQISSLPEVSPEINLENNLTKNLQEAVGETIAKQIESKNDFNPENLEKETDYNLDPVSGQLTDQLVKNSLSGLNLTATIDESKLKISPDISKEAKINYLNSLQKISQKKFSDFNKNYLEVVVDAYQKIDSSSAKRLAEIYKNLSDEYFNLPVPKDWLDFHKKIILYAKNAETIYQAMSEYSQDPVKGYLALDMIDIIVSNSRQIQDNFQQKTKEIEL